MTNRSARRARMFSLSARMARRAAARLDYVENEDGDDAHHDDGCVMCVAMRDGAPFDSASAGARRTLIAQVPPLN